MGMTNKTGFPANSIRLCFENFNEEVCDGKICGVALEESIPFHAMSELIIKIDDAFNEIGQPQPHQVLRSFQETPAYQPYSVNPRRYHSSEEIAGCRGTIGTLDVVMISRHRAEWQGIVKEVDGTTVGRFNSSLECVELLGKRINNVGE